MLLLALLAMTGTGTAQWLHYPTSGVPKLPNGKPNLNAPAPRTADGHPDFSGIWIETDATPDVCAPGETVCIRQEPLPRRAINIGLSSAEQLDKIRKGDAGFVLGLLPYQPWALDLLKQRAAVSRGLGAHGDLANIDPHARCLPPNFPRAWALPQNKKIVEGPGVLVILDEFNASYRQIFTDARPLPEDPQPSWNGYSSGKWEGDTLVVTTAGFRDDLWLDMAGSPLTGAAQVTERLRRPNYGTLQVEVTVNDPKAYTKPWTVQMDQSIVLNTDLLEDVCLENEQDVGHYVGK
jgi:hypothetical protein